MHKIYVNCKDRLPKTLSATLNVLVKWKGEKRPPEQKSESRKGVTLTTKLNIGGFRGY